MVAIELTRIFWLILTIYAWNELIWNRDGSTCFPSLPFDGQVSIFVSNSMSWVSVNYFSESVNFVLALAKWLANALNHSKTLVSVSRCGFASLQPNDKEGTPPCVIPSWAPILCSALCAPYDGLLRAAAFRGDISHLWFQKGSVGNAFHCLVLCCRAAASYSKWKRASNIKNYVQWKFLQTQDHRAKDCSGFSVVT